MTDTNNSGTKNQQCAKPQTSAKNKLGPGTRAAFFMLILLLMPFVGWGLCWILFTLPENNEHYFAWPPPVNYPRPTVSNIQYASHKGVPANLTSLDLYLPVSPGPNPAIIYIHGGAWQFGDKVPVFDPVGMNNANIAIVSINYRLSPQAMHPAHIQDIAAAIAFIHDNAAKYRINPRKLIVIGHSAGAHLAALIASDRRRLEKHGIAPAYLAGVILLDGSSYDIPLLMEEFPENAKPKCTKAIGTQPAALQDASPITHLRSAGAFPPFLVVHAGNNPITARQAGVFSDALEAAGATIKTYYAPELDHVGVLNTLGVENHPMTNYVMEFIRECTGWPTTSTRPASMPH